ncbi:MAG: glycosyltransferase family 2 protein [Proteobacteria bacterium]|nr:glycosyltransferase family 2 protein [Pseudomonadota bacterium]
MIDISVIIPTFNRLWGLPKAVDSCFSAGCSVEVIVVDDGSTDGTWEWLQARKDVTSIRRDNWGKDWAVAAGMAAATGTYVRFLDSDDWLQPEANADQFKLARESDADIVLAGYTDFFESSQRLEPHSWVDCDDFVAQQFGEVPFSHYSAFLFRRGFIQDIPHRQEFALRDDRMFMLEVAIRRPRLAVYRKSAFVHRHHSRGRLQRQTGFRRMYADWTNIEVYRKAAALLEARGELSPRRRRAAASYIWPIVRNLARAELDEAAAAAEWISRLDPAFVPSVRKPILLGYKWLGFRATERLLGMRARIRGIPSSGPPE